MTKVDDKTEEIKYKFYSFILQSFNITNIGSVKLLGDHKAIFPSGNIITATYQKFIIYDSNFNIIQTINYKYIYSTSYVDIYDENNFVSGNDCDIITWIKNNNEFSMNKLIKGAHGKIIDQVIYNSKGNLISCSWDGFIKIWELKNGEYKNIVTFNHTENVKSFLLFENRNILFSFGYGMLKSWNLTNNKFISSNNNFNKFGIEKLTKMMKKDLCYIIIHI